MLTNARIPKLIKLGFFKDESAAKTYINELLEIKKDNSRTVRYTYAFATFLSLTRPCRSPSAPYYHVIQYIP